MSERQLSDYSENHVIESDEIVDRLVGDINQAATEEEIYQQYAAVYDVFKAKLITLRAYQEVHEILEHRLFSIELERNRKHRHVAETASRQSQKISSTALRLWGRKKA